VPATQGSRTTDARQFGLPGGPGPGSGSGSDPLDDRRMPAGRADRGGRGGL